MNILILNNFIDFGNSPQTILTREDIMENIWYVSDMYLAIYF